MIRSQNGHIRVKVRELAMKNQPSADANTTTSHGVSPRFKAWDIGLPRTGTKTFCQAIKLLGYQKVKHNPRLEHLSDLDAAADAGCVIYYKYIDYKYPNSKFILCTRDLDSWLASAEFIYTKYPSTDRDIAILRRMMIYETVTFDRQKFIDAYHRYHDDVRRYFKDRPHDLLEMSISAGDGWEKLCPFLEIPIPEVEFPHLNKRTDFYPEPRPLETTKFQLVDI
jgi:hypothetical protein